MLVLNPRPAPIYLVDEQSPKIIAGCEFARLESELPAVEVLLQRLRVADADQRVTAIRSVRGPRE